MWWDIVFLVIRYLKSLIVSLHKNIILKIIEWLDQLTDCNLTFHCSLFRIQTVTTYSDSTDWICCTTISKFIESEDHSEFQLDTSSSCKAGVRFQVNVTLLFFPFINGKSNPQSVRQKYFSMMNIGGKSVMVMFLDFSNAIRHKPQHNGRKAATDANASWVIDLTGQLQDVTKLPFSHFFLSTCQRSEWVVKMLRLKKGKMNCNR